MKKYIQNRLETLLDASNNTDNCYIIAPIDINNITTRTLKHPLKYNHIIYDIFKSDLEYLYMCNLLNQYLTF